MNVEIYLRANLSSIGVGVQRYRLVLDFSEPLLGCLIKPVLLFLGLREFPLNDLIHWVLETVYWRKFVETVMAAVVLELWQWVVPNRRLFIVEIGVSVDDFAALITPDWVLPGEVLETGLQISMIVIDHKFWPQLLRHELLRRWDTRC